MTFNRANVLLPKKNINMTKWAVVACDQYTSQLDYWERAYDTVGKNPSTLKMIVPEVYLESDNVDKIIKDVNDTMTQYLNDDIFTEYNNTYIYVERTLANGDIRRGIVGMVDLEDYDYMVGSKTKIRATEGTVVSRIPPRLKVRKNAPLELPHIMMLIDDASCDIIESNSSITDSFEKVYDFDLMENSGHITGYRMSESACQMLEEKLGKLEDVNLFNTKYNVNETSPLIYAMGDGNHSLATAKAYYEELKSEIGEESAKKTPARYALCELVNLHDSSLQFEAIHRVVFNVDAQDFLKEFSSIYNISYEPDAKGQSFVFVYGDTKKKITVTNPKEYLTVATVQNFIDNYIKNHNASVDYIHGEDVVCDLCKDLGNIGIIFDSMDKNDLYKSVILDGALPRKTFSMGEACDKRFYVEARKIR